MKRIATSQTSIFLTWGILRMKIEFDTKSDETGKGRIIVDGRYFGLPVEAVKVLDQAYKQNEGKQNETTS